jgi:hypothetical protein
VSFSDSVFQGTFALLLVVHGAVWLTVELLQRRQADDGYEWKVLGQPKRSDEKDGTEKRFQCVACEAVRVVRWNLQLEIESDDTAPPHSHPKTDKMKPPKDGHVWKTERMTMLPKGSERVYACDAWRSCMARRTVRWDAQGVVESDVTEPQHIHVAKQERAKGSAKSGVRWAPKRKDGYAWRVIRDVPLPFGRENVHVCVSAACPAVRTVRWGADLKIKSDVSRSTVS